MSTPSPALMGCLTDPTGSCQGYVEAIRVGYTSASLIVGATLPIIFVNIVLPIQRLSINKSNIRAWFLLLGAISELIAGICITKSLFIGRSEGIFIMGYIMWTIALMALVSAGIVRFSIPFGVRYREKRIYVVASSLVVVVFGMAVLGIGVKEITTWTFLPPPAHQDAFTMTQTALVMVLPAFYAISGFVAFSFQIGRALKSTSTPVSNSTGHSKMRSLEISNYILGGFLLVSIIIYFAFCKTFKDDTKYDTPTALLFEVAWTTCENVFEIFTNAFHKTTARLQSASSIQVNKQAPSHEMTA